MWHVAVVANDIDNKCSVDSRHEHITPIPIEMLKLPMQLQAYHVHDQDNCNEVPLKHCSKLMFVVRIV